MRTKLTTLVVALAWIGAPALPRAAAQESNPEHQRVLSALAHKQASAARQLQELVERAQDQIQALEERGEKEKAALLRQAVRIVSEKRIGIASVATAAGTSRKTLGALEQAMSAMKRILEERPDATEEVQVIGRQVVKALEDVLEVLTGEDEVKSLEERERELKDAAATARELARKQADLARRTRQAVERTPAEKAAAAITKLLDRLAGRVEDLSRRARAELEELDRARERATRLEELLERQRRLRTETGIRAGRKDTLAPRVNRAVAELDAVAHAADEAARRAEAAEARAALARRARGLAKRQEEIARDVEARAALERAREALRARDREGFEQALAQAAERVRGEGAKALQRIAGTDLDDPVAKTRAAAAIQAALDKVEPRATLASDEAALARDVDRAMRETDAPGGAEALREGLKKARAAAEELEAGRQGEREARAAANALRAAAESLAKPGATQSEPKVAPAAQRAEQAAQAIDAFAEDPSAAKAGMSGSSREAAAKARKAAQALREADRRDPGKDPGAARASAEAAARAAREAAAKLRSGIREGEDLEARQAKLSEDLERLAAQESSASKRGMQEAAGKAKQARDALRKSDFKRAAARQDEVIAKLDKLTAQAKEALEKAAAKQAQALQRIEEATGAAADQAGRIGKQLDGAATKAREAGSRRRLTDAADQTRKAEEALRRSLRRLRDLLPKSAGEDRREALEHVKEARRKLDDLREKHPVPGPEGRARLKELSKRQKELQDQVRHLEELLRRKQQGAGADRMQDAQAAMREARRHLDSGEADEAEKAQRRAEKSLKEARKELNHEERRYRALRQYELLFKLKEELARFRRTAQAERETLTHIEALVRKAGRVTRLIKKNDLNPLRQGVKTLQRDVAEKAAAVKKEQAVVYTYILENCATDLQEVVSQLSLKEVGFVPQELLGDVVRRFDMALDGLNRNLERRREEQKKKQGSKQPPQGGQPRLVPPDAEIRMVMVLQRALNQEREGFFASRPDFGARDASPEERARLERLYHQQGSLAELFDGLRQAFLHADEEEPAFPEHKPEGEGDGR